MEGDNPQVYEKPLQLTGIYSALQQEPGYEPTQKVYGQGQYSRAKIANTVSEPNREIKNYDESDHVVDPVAKFGAPFYDTVLGQFQPILTSGTVQFKGTLCQIAQGTDAHQREGRNVLVTGIIVKGTIRTSQAPEGADDTEGSQTIRLMLLLDRQANGQAPLLEEIVDNPLANGINAQMNLNNAQRFSVLQEKYYTLNSTGRVGTAGAYPDGQPITAVANFTINHKCNTPSPARSSPAPISPPTR